MDAYRPRACLAPPIAVRGSLAGADPAFELESDHWRAPWLAAVEGFVAAQAKASAHGS